MAILKTMAYMQRDKIRDAYDVPFIINNYYDKLNENTKILLQDALSYKGIEHLDYLIHNQPDELIDNKKLEDNFLEA